LGEGGEEKGERKEEAERVNGLIIFAEKMAGLEG